MTKRLPQVEGSPSQCQLCGSENLEKFWVAGAANFWLCRKCELYQYGQPPKNEAAYGLNYNTYAKRRGQKLRTAQVRLNRVAAVTNRSVSIKQQTPRLLDIGSNIGITLEAAEQRRWRSIGVDINKDMVRYCQQNGHESVSYEGGRLPFESQTFDVLTAWHVIEHVTDVRKTLADWRRVLRDDGILAIETPDASSPKVRGLARSYKNFWSIEHTYAFTPANLSSFFEEAGFEILWKPVFGNLRQLGPTMGVYAMGYQLQHGLKYCLGIRKSFQLFARKTAKKNIAQTTAA